MARQQDPAPRLVEHRAGFFAALNNYSEKATTLAIAAEGALTVFDLIDPSEAATKMRARLQQAIDAFKAA